MIRTAPPPRDVHVITDDAEAIGAAHRLAAGFAPGASDRDRNRVLPWDELEAFSASGLWGITIPAEHGGAGVSAVTLARVIAIIGAADGSLAQIPQNHFYALEVLRSGGSPEQRAYFDRLALSGHRFGNALAEIGARDFKRRTRLFHDNGRLLVEGRKFYCTGAIYAHWIPTLVVDEDERQQLVFIPRDAPGVSITDDWDGFGQRGTGSGSVAFDRVEVRPEWVIPFQASFERPTPIGPLAQLLHAAIDLGIGKGAFAATLPFIRDRARPWIDAKVQRAADDPLLVAGVGEVSVRLRAAEALVDRAGRAVDEAIADPTEFTVAQASLSVAAARALTTTAGLLATSKLFELTGTSATLTEDNLDRHWRNVRTHTLHDPVRWKYHAVGNHSLNGINPPRHGAI
ncbi:MULTISPECIES: SfnB family sulfur acquisition oxidoreductase [Paracoccus]|uniref:Dibenzothiophene monooxygenase n=1 Tax=Paracoccus kondratievae TaxID=135740 RepID=A0AAD3RTY7_9RHOB|nr:MULTISPECIES: SfnB family sulfur acquisition oxidoreductase [Paracoccus]GLK65023.1 SfnB family sulfur acquisition oxidoreductase [Paracoccus kondratievae]SMG55052.1 sulfur acquisition oxidoreductase, SfnB family [Paracoccus sp. J56]